MNAKDLVIHQSAHWHPWSFTSRTVPHGDSGEDGEAQIKKTRNFPPICGAAKAKDIVWYFVGKSIIDGKAKDSVEKQVQASC